MLSSPLPLNPHYSSLIPLHPLPHYLSPSFLSVILLITSLPLNFPHHLSIPLNPPPHYLSSISCNIIIHLITSVFLPSPSSLLTLPRCLSPSFSILFLITFSVYFSPPSSSFSSLLPPHYFSPPRLPLSLRPFYPLPSNLLFTTCFTTSSSLSSSLSPSFSISTPSLIPPRHPPFLYLYLSFFSIIFLPFSLRPLYPSLYIPSFLPTSSYNVPVSCAFQHLANLSFSHLH